MSERNEQSEAVEVLNYLPPRKPERIFYIESAKSRIHRARSGIDELK
jgi:hypothetical protein